MKNSKLAVVFNSTTEGLLFYYKIRFRYFRDNCIFLANRKVYERGYSHAISSISRGTGFSICSIFDALYSLTNLVQIRKRNVQTIFFEAPHSSNIFLALINVATNGYNIFTVHDWNPHPGKQSRNVRLYNKLIDTIPRTTILLHSTLGAPKSPTIVQHLSGYSITKKSSTNNKKYVLFFGRMEPYKGFEYLVDISKHLKKTHPELTLLIAGNGNIPNYNQLCHLNNVEIRNRFIPEEELEQIFGSTMLSLVPYTSATQSGVILLSYSYGVPVVAFDTGALKDYVTSGESGELAHNGDVGNFCSKISLIIKNHDTYTKRIPVIVENKFSIRKFSIDFKTVINFGTPKVERVL